MKKILYTICGSFCLSSIISQNLVTNGDFETVSSCPTTISQIANAPSWGNGSNTDYGTPDLYNNGGACSYMPSGNGHGTQVANGGNGFAAIFCYRTVSGSPVNNNEYLVTPLNTAMTVGTCYTISFYVSTDGGSAFAAKYTIDQIGVYLSTSAPPCTNVSAPCSASSVVMAVTPQMTTAAGTFPNSTWQQFSFSYTPASAFQYITIGNFKTAASTTTATNYATGQNFAYLYLDDIAVQPCTVLPIELTNFSGSCLKNQTIALKWTTATETNNKEFVIERSTDGNSFTNIGIVPGSGTTTIVRNYSFSDPTTNEGTNDFIYYRLKQIDFNGASKTSNMITVSSCKSPGVIMVSPNPSDGNFIITNPSNDLVEYEVFNDIGEVVLRGEGNAYEMPLDLTEAKKGVYFLRIYTSDKTINLKLLKTK